MDVRSKAHASAAPLFTCVCRARARIFQGSDSGRDSSVESDGKQPVARPRQPLGPVDGSRGFTRRAVADGVQPPSSSSSGVSQRVASPGPIERGVYPVPNQSPVERNSLRPDAIPQSEAQVDPLTSNRKPRQQWDSDMYDPDFDRSYHRWVTPPFVPVGPDQFTVSKVWTNAHPQDLINLSGLSFFPCCVAIGHESKRHSPA